MKASISLVLLLLCGCAMVERLLVAEQPPQRVAQQPADIRPKAQAAKAQTAKPPKPWPVALVSASELDLPPWRTPSQKPTQVLETTLTPSQLFNSVSPAVYAVMMRGQFRGSAVAVSRGEAITNCHVVVRAEAIVLVNASAQHRAEVASADRSTDRCSLRVLDGELEAVLGFRDYASLAVGESVYTIGSPKGMVNTLGNGLVSGLRKSEDTQFIQITAPVSKGSSGGALFDDRGNLIGVTTFTIQDSQNLNFAIAASQFWQ
jgi:S1-C subfamily serine protease